MTPIGRAPFRFLLVSAFLFASTAIAAAQTAPPAPAPPPQGPPTGGWRHPGDHRHGPQDWAAEQAKMQERRLADLHTKLDLKPGQEPAWQAFVTGLQAARPTPKPDRTHDWQQAKLETTPERLDHMLARIDEMRARLAQLDQVVKTFYASLSKDQQTIFDDNFKRMGHPHGHPGGWDRGGPDHGRGGPPPSGYGMGGPPPED